MKYLAMLQRLFHVDVSKSIFQLSSHLVYFNRKLDQWIFKHETWWGNTKISSYFSLWKLDYFSDMAFFKNTFDTRKILDGKPLMFFFLNPANHIEFFSVIWKPGIDPGCILQNINPIPTGEIPTKAFPVWVFHVIEKVCVLKLQ